MTGWRDRAWMLGALAAVVVLGGGLKLGLRPTLIFFSIVAILGGAAAISIRASLDRLEPAVRRQRARSIAIAAVLFGLVVLFYAATIVRLGPNALRREGMPSPTVVVPSGSAAPDACKRAGTC